MTAPPQILQSTEALTAALEDRLTPTHHRIGQILLHQGLIDQRTLDAATLLQNRHPERRLGEILRELVDLDEASVQQALGRLTVPLQVDLNHIPPDPHVAAAINGDLAWRFLVLPLRYCHDHLVVCCSVPLSNEQRDLLRFYAQRPIIDVGADSATILRCLAETYGAVPTPDPLSTDLATALIEPVIEPEAAADAETELRAQDAPIVQLVNNIVLDALARRASDIHLRPGAQATTLEYRVDGILQRIRELPRALHPIVVSRLKILGRMNISEHRHGQDGRAQFRHGQHQVELRLSVLPSEFGESVVIRLADRSSNLRTLDTLEFPGAALLQFRDILQRSGGLILVTGPTGSGKSTTLYAALQDIARRAVSIITVEDPVEYEIDGLLQIPVNPAAGFDFPDVLRHILRHDPDVVMIGEIRDSATCRIAMEAALTGHLVLSSLHTVDAPSAVVRLIEMGVAPYLIKSSLIAVIAQRLVRRNCTYCQAPEVVNDDLLRQLQAPAQTYLGGAGCAHCGQTGYFGQLALYELLILNDALRGHIHADTTAADLLPLARAAGMTTLLENGVAAAAAHHTTLAEVARVCL